MEDINVGLVLIGLAVTTVVVGLILERIVNTMKRAHLADMKKYYNHEDNK